jgi:hypothetical protein
MSHQTSNYGRMILLGLQKKFAHIYAGMSFDDRQKHRAKRRARALVVKASRRSNRGG